MSDATGHVLAAVTDLVRSSTGRLLPDDVIAPEAALVADLGLDSIELVGLVGRLQARFGEQVNVSSFLASLDADGATDVRVMQVVEFIVASSGDG